MPQSITIYIIFITFLQTHGMFTKHIIYFISSFYILRPLFTFSKKNKNKKTIKPSIFSLCCLTVKQYLAFAVRCKIKGKNNFEKILHYENSNLKTRCLLTTLKLGKNKKSKHVYILCFIFFQTLYASRIRLIFRHLHSLCKVNTSKMYPFSRTKYLCVFFLNIYFMTRSQQMATEYCTSLKIHFVQMP